MKGLILCPALILLVRLTAGSYVLAADPASVAGSSAASKAVAPEPSRIDESAIKSGVYGFSGAKAGDNDPKGVVGECIWIFDQSNKAQLAKGDCLESDPGKFRVALKPGKYIVRGPGGNRPIEVKEGQWIKVVSIVPLPVSF
ncbi:MAG: hypothetical protein ABSG46_16335 [Candidatus Binataceae bacterium]